ncbi:hypothetical protein AMTRI_Chr09g19180 [Amborella trichopoda]
MDQSTPTVKGKMEGGEMGGGERKRGKRREKKRFSQEQVRLEAKRKGELARELGLNPRQIAIWFQNRRARWKSKQLERDYGVLGADYQALLSSFQSLKQEKRTLIKQLQKLGAVLEKSEASGSAEGDDTVKDATAYSDGEYSREVNGSKLVYDEPEMLYKAEEVLMGSFSPTIKTSPSDSGWFCDQPFTSSQWWELWP